MVRSLFAGSLVALACGAGLVACSSNDTSGGSSSTTSGTGGASTTTTTTSSGGGEGGASTSSGGGQGGVGGASTTTTTTSSGTGGVGGTGGIGGAGGTGGAMGLGGAGGAAAGTGGSGGVEEVDQDGDGWTVSQGDCCDSANDCGKPTLVNPGAFEYLGNSVDDDCDPSTPDNVPAADCAPANTALQTPTSSTKLIKAMDLCQFTTENPPLKSRKWGVISTALTMADQSNPPAPKDLQVGVLADYGPYVMPQKGGTMAALSTGTARDEDDPGHVYPQNGLTVGQVGNYNAGTQSSVSPEYLSAHGNSVPSPEACPTCSGAACTTAFDPVDLRARIRVPTNALSFTYNFKFYSAEFPEFVCQQFNDFFVTLLKTSWMPAPGEDPLPADANIAFDAQHDPVSVNNAFFQVCFPPPGAAPGECPSGTLELVGTGMGGWPVNGQANVKDGGGTVWLKNDAPVVPGETIEIQWIIWDAGDHNVDSLVLLDKFRWNITPSTVGVHE